MKNLLLLSFLLASCGCWKQSFLEDTHYWIAEQGQFKQQELIKYKDSSISFYDGMLFQDGHIYFEYNGLHSKSNLYINYKLGEPLSSIIYPIKIWSEKDTINEEGYLLIDNIENGIDNNRCKEILIKTPNLELYLWRPLDNIFVPDKFGTNDLNLDMIPDRI